MQATIKLKDGEYIGIDNLQLIRQHESMKTLSYIKRNILLLVIQSI